VSGAIAKISGDVNYEAKEKAGRMVFASGLDFFRWAIALFIP
jgi:hypothetical protein